MKSIALIVALVLTFLQPAIAQVSKPGKYYVVTETSSVRLAPVASAKETNVLRTRQAVDVIEVKGQWARISKYYDGAVEGQAGDVARWVRAADLSPTRPPDEKARSDEPEIAKLLVDSDDFSRYRKAFIKASQDLVARGQCSLQDFKEIGGWMKSTNAPTAPVYFMYCGGMTKANRIFLNARTGEVFR
ncbi:hypothetical protein SNE35_18820 [Paucibacter sp. R3-3]|uniref:SH3b domain-containing protein n=1 Tax=Roseateles agri TaxID=3098619 RepID=A0ABU5DKB9_9BURK|nr:hypothetical protein [Paucibacter sp. R3-3]MDY0746574.1 hypothetical protein [Paucibacter sp. R3-3]